MTKWLKEVIPSMVPFHSYTLVHELSQHFVKTRRRAQQGSGRTKYPSANTHLRDKRWCQDCQCGEPKSCGTVAALENYSPSSESVKCILAGRFIEETFKTIPPPPF